MQIRGHHLSSAFVVVLAAWSGQASAQSLGTFNWQLQPFCNRVTVNVTQNEAIYTLDGFDDQCGAAQRAPLVGLATPNPDGTIGFGLHIVTVPGGRDIHIDARIDLGSFGGPWTDSAGNSGTFVLSGQAGGSPRPVPTIPAVALTPGSVTTTVIADGTVGAADVNSSQIQLRISGACSYGQYLTGVSVAGAPTCTPGVTNTALGLLAMTGGSGSSGNNTAIGNAALRDLQTGTNNTAVGQAAMLLTTTGQQNVAVGNGAMSSNVTGVNNVAVGLSALRTSSGGGLNVAIGYNALSNATGTNNVAVGYLAGDSVTTGGNNVHIANTGTAADSATIRIGSGTQTRAFLAGVRGVTTATAAIPVLVGTDGQLGTTSSSRRYKFDIADMGDFSARLAKLRPVMFRYRQPRADGSTPLDFGLIAEEVAEVFPELAVRGADGEIETVAYHKLPALLLNELQKQQAVAAAQAQELVTLRRLIEELRTELTRAPR